MIDPKLDELACRLYEGLPPRFGAEDLARAVSEGMLPKKSLVDGQMYAGCRPSGLERALSWRAVEIDRILNFFFFAAGLFWVSRRDKAWEEAIRLQKIVYDMNREWVKVMGWDQSFSWTDSRPC